jgi:hypothetical protein
MNKDSGVAQLARQKYRQPKVPGCGIMPINGSTHAYRNTSESDTLGSCCLLKLSNAELSFCDMADGTVFGTERHTVY